MTQLIKNLSEPKNLIVVCVLYTTIITIIFLVPISAGTHIDLPIDKFVHFTLHAALIFLWLTFFYAKGAIKKWQNLLGLCLLTIFYGIIIEILQELLTRTRNADVWDVIANIIGCTIGFLLFKVLKTKFSS